MQSDKGCKASDTETEVEVSSTSSDGKINNVSVNKNEYNTSGHDDRSIKCALSLRHVHAKRESMLLVK